MATTVEAPESGIPQAITLLVQDMASRGADPALVVQTLLRSVAVAFDGQIMSKADRQLEFVLAGRAGRYALMKEEGGCVDSSNAAVLYSGDPDKPAHAETVRRAAREDRLIAIRDGHGDFAFPVWQFKEGGGALDGLREVLRELKQRPGYSEITPFRFFLHHHPQTEGRPLDALRKGRIEAAIAAAIAERD